MTLRELFAEPQEPTKKKISITVDSDLLSKVDDIAKDVDGSRSKTIEVLIKLGLEKLQTITDGGPVKNNG